MYHIKKDKRCETSVMLIYNALIKLLASKNFDAITITDIQAVSTIGRATFYRHFDSLIDVLVMKCDMEFEKFHTSYVETIQKTDLVNIEFSHFIRYYLEYWITHIEIIEVLIKINRVDIIFQSLRNTSTILLKVLSPTLQMDSSDYNYFIALRCGLIIGLWITWINEGKKKTIDELMNILMTTFDQCLI